VSPQQAKQVSHETIQRLAECSAQPRICVEQPATEHTVSVSTLQTWLDGGGKSPNEQVQKPMLREIFRT
jgi:hypothetical protein